MDSLDWLIAVETLAPRELILVNDFETACNSVPVDESVDDRYLTHASRLHCECYHVVSCVIEAQVDDLLLSLLEEFDAALQKSFNLFLYLLLALGRVIAS